MPTVTLDPASNIPMSLWSTKFCSYVQVTHAPTDHASFRGKVCLWTNDNALIPLDEPGHQIIIRDKNIELQFLVRYLTEGEVLTIKF